jgi:hypothetical protein
MLEAQSCWNPLADMNGTPLSCPCYHWTPQVSNLSCSAHPSIGSFKLGCNLDKAPNLNGYWQNPEICTPFSKLFNHVININFQQTTSHPWYLSINLQKAIYVKVVYDIGADISCLSKQIFWAIPTDLDPAHQNIPIKPYDGASGQSLQVMGYNISFTSSTISLKT